MEGFFSLVYQMLAEHLGGSNQDGDSVPLGYANTSRIQLVF